MVRVRLANIVLGVSRRLGVSTVGYYLGRVICLGVGHYREDNCR